MPPGHEAWVTRDYGGTGKALTMSATSLGSFVFHLLRLGGAITSTHAMRPDLPRSYVQFAVSLPAGQRQALEAASGVALEKPGIMVPA